MDKMNGLFGNLRLHAVSDRVVSGSYHIAKDAVFVLGHWPTT